MLKCTDFIFFVFSAVVCLYMIDVKELVLIDFSLSVKAVTLIFVSRRVRLFHLLNKGIQILFIIW